MAPEYFEFKLKEVENKIEYSKKHNIRANLSDKDIEIVLQSQQSIYDLMYGIGKVKVDYVWPIDQLIPDIVVEHI